MIVYPKVRTAADARKRLIKLESRRDANLYREPKPDRVPPPITLPAVSMGAVTDEDVGLTPDPVAQLKAETFLKNAYAYRLREAAKAQAASPITVPAVVNVEIADESLSMSSDDAVILAELRRLEAMPLPRWMQPSPGRLAS